MRFDELAPGQTYTTATRTLSEADIIAFAKQWDRQSFHLDPEAAKDSFFGGLIASGFHTMLTAFDLVIEAGIWTEMSQGSPGLDQVRWIKPVRPGDTLHVELEVLSVRPSTSRADRGYSDWEYRVLNQSDEVVMDWRSTLICATGA